MIKKCTMFLLVILFAVNASGCFLLLAGAAGGAGTAGWLSGKLSQEVNAPYEKTLKAVTSALDSLKFDITKKTVTDDVSQFMSNYTDGRTIWIDVRNVSEKVSKVEIRVGMTGDQEASRKILDKIERYL